MKLERGIPAPVPDDANERVHRVDAEAEAFMKAHANGIINSWLSTGDPAGYPGWDSQAVRQHWPELWSRWRALGQAKDRLAVLLNQEYERRKPRRPL